MTKKCIVVDLDNTLWGGIVGEDGVGGIALSLHEEPGASYVAFQQALQDMYNRGVILAVNSNNNPEDVLEVIRTHPNMILKEKHFAAIRINWQDKVENIKELAKELNIGTDTMVFLDDNPLNREAVRSFLPEVEVPDMDDPTLYAKTLLSLPYFPAHAETSEDAMRGNMYVTEKLRMEAQKKFANKEDFLGSLSLELFVSHNDTTALPRLSQMSEKTNQFNTHKQPMNVEELGALMQNPQYEVVHARLTDRFGDHGIIALAIVKKEAGVWHISSFLMSCRVFGRGAEQAFLYALAQRAAQQEGAELTISFVPSDKNEPARLFVEEYFKQQPIAAADISLPQWMALSVPAQ